MTTSTHYDAIVIGAGVIGPTIATALARQGRKVLILERDWSKPDRIVGELMQPAGIKALRELGMVKSINNINAVNCTGYYVKFHDEAVTIPYPLKKDANITNPMKPVPDVVDGINDKVDGDDSINIEEWDNDERVRGVAFHHGDFLMNLRQICRDEPNVTAVEATVTKILRDPFDSSIVIGVQAKQNDEVVEYHGKLTISCDGIYSKFRKELSPTNVPTIGSYFIGLYLKNAVLPVPGKGHVLLGDHSPVLIYPVSPTETRVLCAYASTKPPSAANDEVYTYIRDEVLPIVPKETVPAFKEALEGRKFRIMPNQYLSAMKQGSENHLGFILLGDSLNMRHPLTGGGMTVGLNDSVLLAKLIHPKYVDDLGDHQLVAQRLKVFHRKRKNLDAVINTLSIALYSLFAADKKALKILQNGCFRYFQRGGECLNGPIGLLSGTLPYPMLLFNHFFSVALYAIYLNFVARGLPGFPLALLEALDTLFTAIIVFTPYLWAELVQ
ncbi:ERG1 Squalene epoxidase ERG1 [Candida maltosa Xu316]|uniref:Squalene monooxygenase n=2 Tax=Candida maltosa TaxID=5479 RepID=M3JSB4_CANMX|nr:Squalene monooxygenase [Candida maltosa Xu316]